MQVRFVFVLFIVIITFSCKEKQRKYTNENVEVPITKVKIQESLLDTIPTVLKKLDYELHPYSGYPLFINNRNKEYYYAIAVISSDTVVKDNWVFDELTFNEEIIAKTRQYILKNENSYNQILLLIKDSLYEQDGVFSPSENFNYELYLKKDNVWILKKRSIFKQDFFIFLDSFFLKEAKSILN